MGIFQRLNQERGITVLLITHEMDIAEYGTRTVTFRDGQVVADRPVARRRVADDELAALPGRRGRIEEPHMSFLMILRIALKALGRNKMRTALTMLGMIIGVAAVITMVALGTGAQSSIEAQIQSAGTNMIMVSAGNFMQGGVRHGPGQRQHARARRTRRRSRSCPGVQYVAAGSNTRGQIIAGNQNWNTQVQGTDVDMPLIRSWPVERRRVLHAAGRRDRRRRSRCSAA